jgi:hypothetical protein
VERATGDAGDVVTVDDDVPPAPHPFARLAAHVRS